MLNIIVLLLSCLLLQCQNPFFPNTGKPIDVVRLDTPESVIEGLRKSYENRRIDLFTNLIYSDSLFRYYIQYNPYKDANLERISAKTLLSESYVPIGEYFYLDYNTELRVHDKMFDNAETILFKEPLVVFKTEYLFDTVIVRSGISQDSTDSIYIFEDAIVHTDMCVISISAQIIQDIYNVFSKDFNVGKQSFYMRKNELGEWGILYWFELD